LSVRTVERHLRKIYAKIDVRSRAAATAYTVTQGLVDLRCGRDPVAARDALRRA
jgi:hypothetical protein